MTNDDPKERFVFVDGLRGVAALAVMCCHIEETSPLAHSVPRLAANVLEHGQYGVQIFFVISGFVIAHSLSRLTITAGSAFNFIVRRQIRLDPTYWTVLLITCAVARTFGQPAVWDTAVPRAAFLANMFYLHELLKIEPVLLVSWTLCLEVQFYLIYIVILWLVQRAAAGKGQGAALLAILLPMIALSFWLHFMPDFPRAVFIKTWYLFALGAMICWTMQQRLPRGFLLVTLAVLACSAISNLDPEMFSGAATGAVIYLAVVRGGLTRWLSGRVARYFGRISYSLYLVHFNVIHDVLRVGRHITGDDGIWPIFWLAFSVALSIAIAQVLHELIEQPTMNLASRLKPRAITAPSPTAAANPPADSAANTTPPHTPATP
jgi:peptidoglycan/LPS O-acetylase OafA/YrhL